MNKYDQIKTMKNKFWTNTLKCDLQKNILDLREKQKHIIDTGMNSIFKSNKLFVKKLKNDIKIYQQAEKQINANYKDKTLSGIKDQHLFERYGKLHPNDIKKSIMRSIYKVNNELNILEPSMEKNKVRLKKIHEQLLYMHKKSKKPVLENVKAIRIMLKVSEIEKKIPLLDLSNRKTQQIIDLVKQDLILCDNFLDQLQNDADKLTSNIIEHILVGTYFKEDHSTYNQYFSDIQASMDKHMHNEITRIDLLNAKMDTLERSRKSLMKDSPMTEIEKTFYLKLPQSLDTYDDPFSDINVLDSKLDYTKKSKDSWQSKMSELGMVHFVNEDEKYELTNHLNNDTKASSIDYTIPVNIINYITINNSIPLKDELAVNYALNKTEFCTQEDLIKFVESTKNDIDKLNEFIALRKAIWKLLGKNCSSIAEKTETLELMTTQDIEFGKQEQILKSFIDEQQTKLSDINHTKKHYLQLLNNMYFYMDNVRSKFKKIRFSEDELKQYSNVDSIPFEKVLRTSDKELIIFLKDLKLSIDEIEAKIRWSSLIITDDFDLEEFNLARALYVYQIQSYIQADLLMKQKKLKSATRRTVVIDNPVQLKPITSREETKRQAEEILNYFKDKDTDRSKNKRKPISFRRSFL